MKPILALSTSWNSSRHGDGYAMLREMADLGFAYVELSHGIKTSLVPGVVRALRDRVVQVSSIHNFCPLPVGVERASPNLFEPSVAEEAERERWLRQTKRSIDFAGQVGARVVVTHLGSVRFFWGNPGEKLRRQLESLPTLAEWRSPAARAAARSVETKVRGRRAAAWQRVKHSLDRVRGYAVEKGIPLGCENRERVEELPLDDEFEQLFERESPAVARATGYWHDTGHAELKQAMGLLDHQAHLQRLAPHLLGFHLHDVDLRGHDHQGVGQGCVDFTMISQFWQPHHLLTLELSPRVPVEHVRESKERVERLIAVKDATNLG